MKKLIIFIIIVLIVGPPVYGREVSKTDFIDGINILFLKEDYSGVIKDASNNIRHYRLNRTEKKEVLYLMGLSYIKISDFKKARSVFEDILNMKGDEFRQDAYISIADSYFLEENFDMAIQSYEDVLTMYSRGDRLSSVYYNLGLAYKAKKNSDRANFYFQKVKKQYNESFEADKIAYSPQEKKETYYIIQLGAFKSLKNAKKLVKRLTRKKYDSYIQKVKSHGKFLYRVRAGKFASKYYAKRLLRKLRKDRFHAKIIVE